MTSFNSIDLQAKLESGNIGEIHQHINDKARRSRLHFFAKLVQTILLRPIITTATLAYRTVKLLTWVPVKVGLYKVSGHHHTESVEFFEREYLRTVKAVRDVLFVPSMVKRTFDDLVATRAQCLDDNASLSTNEYLQVQYTKSPQPYSSYLHGYETFEVICPQGIAEFAARSDASLKTIMASHLFKPGMMAINFGSPNVAAFVTEKGANGSVQTVQVDAKSMKRADMTYHPTNGKIQSGVFFVPTNLPAEALSRFTEAAKNMQGRRDITCVNTNCRVLKEAGFSIEGVDMEGVVFPTTLMEHLLFRSVFYTDKEGVKHRVHFDILNTTKRKLEEYAEDVDTAVVGTRLRHRRRDTDTEENQKVRGAAAQAIIEVEAKRLAAAGSPKVIDDQDLGQRKITASVPSFFGDALAHIWGRHTIYEVDLSDKRDEILTAYQQIANRNNEALKLRPFPQEKPSLSTRLKRDIFFSGPMIRLMRRQMMGRVDTIHAHTQDLFNYLKSTDGARLNYALLDNKVVLSRVHANGDRDEAHRKTADWALSKHGLIAGRQEVYCSGEMWYNQTRKCFMMNNESGTYAPSFERVQVAADLANDIFDAQRFGNTFEAVKTN